MRSRAQASISGHAKFNQIVVKLTCIVGAVDHGSDRKAERDSELGSGRSSASLNVVTSLTSMITTLALLKFPAQVGSFSETVVMGPRSMGDLILKIYR